MTIRPNNFTPGYNQLSLPVKTSKKAPQQWPENDGSQQQSLLKNANTRLDWNMNTGGTESCATMNNTTQLNLFI